MKKTVIALLSASLFFLPYAYVAEANSFWMPFQQSEEQPEEEENFEERWKKAQEEEANSDEDERSEEERLEDFDQSFQNIENESGSMFNAESEEQSSFKSGSNNFGFSFGTFNQLWSQLLKNDQESDTTEEGDMGERNPSFSEEWTPVEETEQPAAEKDRDFEGQWDDFDDNWDDFDKSFDATYEQQSESSSGDESRSESISP